MIKRKLAVVLISIIAIVCGIFGIAGCNDTDKHVHTYSEEWTRSATEHWHEATCEHTDEKGNLGTHIDEDNNGKCDVCDYTMQTEEVHTHTFDRSHWEHDANTHWHAATCNDTTERQDEAPHVDEDGDQFCDICEEYVPHTHKFSETEWKFDLDKHWRPATCIHEGEKGSEAEHTFTAGVCECGLKEVEKQAYNALIEHEKLDGEETDFYTWLTGLKADGVTDIRITVKGDIVYDRSGVVEGVYVVQRTVKVKAAIDSGDGLADVWFKVAYNDSKYIEDNGTDALVVAKTDSNGIATLTFNPIGGYTSYKIMLAEAKDVAALAEEDIDEEDVKVTPNRYSVKNSSAGMGEVCNFTVGETDDADTVVGQLDFKYDMSWATSDKHMLSYERAFADAVTGAGEPIVKGERDTFTATGDNTFDYLLFSPAHGYDWSQGNTSADFDKIADNYRKSASGVYEISFTVTGGGSARLYYWDGIDLSIGQKETDGSPSNIYVKSVSGTKPEGSTIANEMFTGKNSVSITIEGYRGLEDFQLGIICQDACQVTITVNRLGDYTPPPPGKLKLGNNTAELGSRKGYTITGTTEFELDEDSGITDGWYTLEVIPHEEYCIMPRTTGSNGRYWIGSPLYVPGELMCRVGNSKTMLWQTCKDGKVAENYGRSFTLYNSTGVDTGEKHSVRDFKNVSLKGVIYLTSTSKISLICNVNVTYYADIDIEPYEQNVQTLEGNAETIEKDTVAFVPATQKANDKSFEFGFGDSIDENTIYRIQVTIPLPYVLKVDSGANGIFASLTLGGVEKKVDGRLVRLQETNTFELNTKIKKSDKLKITSDTAEVNIFMAEVTVTTYQNVGLGVPVTYEQRYMQAPERRLNFTAAEEGTYQVTLTRLQAYEHDCDKMPEWFTDGDVSTFDVKNLLSDNLIIKHTRASSYTGALIENPVLTVSGTIQMQAGESLILEIENYCKNEALQFTLTVTKV